jgi:hypothetical protein
MTGGVPGQEWVGLTDEQANLSKPLATRGWLLPKSVEMRGKRLFYDLISFPPRIVRPGPSVLGEFVQLADGEGERIVRFAKEWGVLRLCKHGLPSPHEALGGAKPWTQRVDCFPGRVRRGSIATVGQRIPLFWLWEPIEAWQLLARRARALLNLTSEVRGGRTGSDEDWKFLTGFPIQRLGQDPSFRDIERDPWVYIADNLNYWFGLRPVVLNFSLDQGRLKIGNLAESLFAYLQMQLAFAVGQGAGLCFCSGCSTFYSPPRRPNPNRRNYCGECGRKAATRDASARYRRKSKSVEPRHDEYAQALPLKCAACRDSNRAGAKFCNACGGPLEAST